MDKRWRLLLVGTYTPDSDPPGKGEGVHRVWFDPVTGELIDGGVAARTPGPSFLALNTRHEAAEGYAVYAVNERAQGTVTAFRVSGEATLAETGSVPSGGGSPCHVLARGSELAVSNYADGVVVLHDLSPDGSLGKRTARFAHRGGGPVADRQEGPHAHSAARVGDHVLVADLGTDELRVYSREGAAGAVGMPPGTGPRHMAADPSGTHVYVSGELDSRVHVVRWDPTTGTGEHVGSVPATAEESAGTNFPAEIAVHGDRVYVSNRGADVLSTFAVRGGGARVEHLADTPVGAWPRHFTVVRGHHGDPDHIVAAAQNGDELMSLRVDPRTGIPGDTGRRLAVPDPVCVLPVPIKRVRRAEGQDV
ncbi:lactonase family protein [Nocardiopsis sp. FIRDI 009]|uniref:lactonase family protein n=1 Tax=Nocardiopsis sp. FIRDI 009 TaxID=714197 RepID=UPI000E24965F|nr:lactonase family protein [Nocardiopsis sp. FIRDI 009]